MIKYSEITYVGLSTQYFALRFSEEILTVLAGSGSMNSEVRHSILKYQCYSTYNGRLNEHHLPLERGWSLSCEMLAGFLAESIMLVM